RQRPFLPPPGEARADWAIMSAVARRLEASGVVAKPKATTSGFSYNGPAEIFAEHARLSAFENDGRRLFDIGALADIPYETLSPSLWPAPSETTSGREARLFADGGFPTDTGRAHLVPVAPPPAMKSEAGLFTLNTGRVRDHWHTMTRTGRSARLSRHYGEPFVEIHPRDAMRRGILPASLVRLETPHGRAILRALLTPRVREGEIFAPMHWTGETAPTGRIDALVPPIVDPYSGQPASKSVPVSLTPAGMAWHGFALLRERPADIPAPYWAVARTERGWRLELAGYREASLTATQEALLGDAPPVRLAGSVAISADPDRGILYSASDPVPVARDWAAGLFDGTAPDAMAKLLAGRPGADAPDPGATVCSCMMVGVNTILDAIAAGARDVDAVGAATQAGMQCGSCRSEIGRLCTEASARDYLEAAE
ncbi:MAG: molybdopterin dinucleotide binding domain-containing protein, partial [Pseudomonadota bacterium]